MTSASKKLLKELPPKETMDEIISDLMALGPQATAIIGAAYLEHSLELLLRTSFRALSKGDDRRMFDGAARGILGTFSAKIRIAYATKLIHKKVYEALLLINEIRNVFAHSLHKVDFGHELIKKDCRQLGMISPRMSSATGMVQPALIEPIKIYTKIVGLLYRSIRYKAENPNEPPALSVP